MNEQDFIHNIDKKTNDLNIPESISPAAMKKRLDETYKNSEKASHENSVKTYNRTLRRTITAACLALCLIGTAGITILLQKNDKSDATDNSSAKDESMIGSDVKDTEKADSKDFEEDLAYQTGLVTPKNYDDYYTDIKSAYDKYYDSISTVITNDIDAGAVSESADTITGGSRNDTALYGDEGSMKEASKSKMNTGSTASKESEHSDTNKQEENVAEGDIIKTDGKYIYKAVVKYDDKTGNYPTTITITKTDNGKLTKISDIELPTVENNNQWIDFKEFYLQDNKLILLYSKSDFSNTTTYDSFIEIYDISNPQKPKKIKVLSQSGVLLSSRISNGYLYTISDYTTMDLSDKSIYRNYIPCVNNDIIDCSKIYYPKDGMLGSTKVITSLKLTDTDNFTDTLSIPGNAAEIYVSEQSIYFYETMYDSVTKTKISKINYKNGKFTVGNSAVIAGYLYGPFAINEYDNHLRIVATIPSNNISLLRSLSVNDTANSPEEDVNALYVLDDKLNLTGKITGIAPGEVIYSARFMENTGYFVTYKNTDPLFSVDLSDPADPKIIGSLKIPGFSNYMHFYGENILLGIGEEIDPKTQQFLGIKLSMFDISDPANVTEKDKQILKNAEYSEALYNYKAIMIDPAKNIFGFAYWSYNDTDNNYYYSTYAYDEKYGFVETASYKIADGAYNVESTRGLYIGNYFYLTTDATIQSYKIGSEEIIDSVNLQ